MENVEFGRSAGVSASVRVCLHLFFSNIRIRKWWHQCRTITIRTRIEPILLRFACFSNFFMHRCMPTHDWFHLFTTQELLLLFWTPKIHFYIEIPLVIWLVFLARFFESKRSANFNWINEITLYEFMNDCQSVQQKWTHKFVIPFSILQSLA